MSSPNFSILFSAKVDGAASAGSAGDVLIPDSTSGEYVKATAANRGTRRSTGIALASYVADGTVEIQQMGQVAASISGLGTGTASWVRVSSTGVLERCTPSSGDDVVGRCETDGTFHAVFGVFDSSNYAGGGGGGGGTPGGSDKDIQYNNAGSFGGISPSTSGNLMISNGTAWASTAPSFAASVVTSGTLVHERGGLEADVSAYSGLVKITGGATSAVTLGTGVETFLTTPSSANLRGAVTDETGSGALVFGTSPTVSGATLTGTVNAGDPGSESGSINYVGGTYPADFKVNAFGSSVVATAIFHRHSTVDGCNVVFSRTNADDSSHATSASGDVISSLIFAGHDGTDYNPAAQITVRVDGAVGANDMPGAIDFYTTPDGSNTPSRALIIDNAQVLTLSKPPKIADSTGGQYYTFAVSNLAADRTVTLPLLGASDTFVFEAHAQTLTNKTISLGSNTVTFTSAQLATACSDETGSGALVFGTSPTLSSPTLSGTPVVSGTALQATGNARCKVYSQVANVQTTDATVTSVDTWTITDECTTLVTVEVLACQSTGANTAAYVRRVRIKRDGGTVTVGTVEDSYTSEEVAGWDVTIDNSTSTGRVRVTGAAATTIDWGCVMTRIEVTHA